MLDETLTIAPPEGAAPWSVNLVMRLTNDLDIQILTGQDFESSLSASRHWRDLFLASS